MSPARKLFFAVAAVIVLSAPSPRAQETFAQTAYLKASNTDAFDQFGSSVAISGDTAVVGAPGESSNSSTDQTNDALSQSGAAYVFVRSGSGWTQQAYLKASDRGIADRFGQAVAISGDTIVVGAPNAGPGGAAYVFVRNATTWTQQAILKASNENAFDSFGTSVAVSGDTIVVGAYAEDSNATVVDGDQGNNNGLESGAAYVFKRNGTTWRQEAYLKASNSNAQDNFGFSVGVSGDTAVIGAFRESSNGTSPGDNTASQAGAAYVFVRSASTWSQQAYLKAAYPGIGDIFGYAVAVSGDTVVVGARNEASGATGVNGDQTNNSVGQAGAAYVFERSGTQWVQQAYLKASNTGSGDQFGTSVGVDRNVIVVGAIGEDSNASAVDGPQDNNMLSNSGAAYVFIRRAGGWSQQSYLKADNSGTPDNFGWSVAVSGAAVLSATPNEPSNATGVDSGGGADNSATQAGAAYIFEFPNSAPTISSAPVTVWPDTSGNFMIAAVDDAEDAPGLLEVSLESANPSNGVTLSSITNVAGSVTADFAAAPGASTASFQVRVTDAWGAFAESTFVVTIVPRVSIAPNISPAANENGWHNEPVTVSWTLANGTPQSGCDPTILSLDTTTTGTTLTCTASNAGGSSSASATIKIDRTAPVGTASRTPSPNGNGWNNTDVLVTFTCADLLSGPVSPGASETISTEGAGQSRAFSCVDLAGNAVPLAVMGVNIDQTAPVVVPASVAASPNPVMVNTAIALSANLTDTGSGGLALAEYRIGAEPYASLASASGNSAAATGSIGSFSTPSVLEACVRALDRAGNQSAEECILLAVFDPSGGYVTGAGTIESPPGALVGSTAAGTARFGFQSKYARGTTVPTGSTSFKFRAGDLEFDSTAYEWLVVAGARAQYKGTGVLRNQTGTFNFLLTVIDGDQPGGGGTDKFRIKISGGGEVVYDNQLGATDNTDPSTAIASGHIVIRK